MLRKRKLSAAISLFLALCMTVSAFAVSTLTVFAADDNIVISDGLDAVPDPIDPQSWQANKDRGWDKFVPNPVIDWSTDLKTEGLANPKAIRDNSLFGTDGTLNRPIRGAIILAEFIDQPFVTSQPIGSDKFGFKRFKTNQPGVYENTVTQNPILNNPDRDTLGQWWADYLNKELEINHGANIDAFWRENTYGKWAVDLIPFGPYVLNGTELQYGGLAAADRPPSLRLNGSNTSALNEAVSLARVGADGKEAFDPDDFDFFFVIHAGYDESGTWLPFGMMQWSANTREEAKTVVPDIFGPKYKMTQLEELFTEHPEHVERMATKTNNSGEPSASQFILDEAAKIKAMREAGTLASYEFKFPQADWDWATANGNSAPTRYVAWTAWAAKAAIWSSSSGGGVNAGLAYESEKYGGIRRLAYSQQGENDGMATFAHEFGHISALPDNYGNPYTDRASAKTEPWELMSRGSFAGPFGDQARWTVPGVEAGSVPVNFLAFNKTATDVYDPGDVLVLTKEELASSAPVVGEIVARNIPLNNRKTADSPEGIYKWLEDEYGLVSPNYYKGIQINFGSGEWADQAGTTANRKTTGFSWNQASTTRMFMEVVQRTGYDSYAPDDGVIISRNDRVVDSHLYDIAMIDYMQKDGFGPGIDDYASHTLGSMAQLYDAAFKAGKSTTDTGYYASVYDPADPNYANEVARYYAGEGNLSWQKNMLKTGSIVQWEDQNDRPVVSGDTVNEFHDPYNKLKFYILQKNTHEAEYGEFLSYTVGVLHEDGQAVGGELKVEKGDLTTALPGKVAVQEYKITNTGDATDIIRLTVGGNLSWNTTLLNNLYAIGAGETITVPVYIEVPENVGKTVAQTLTLTAASESNAAKVAEVTVEDVQDKACVLGLVLTVDRTNINKDDWFRVDTGLTKVTESNVVVLQLVFDSNLFQYNGATAKNGAQLVSSDNGTPDADGKQVATVTLMVTDYEMQDIVSFLFQAKENIADDITLAEAVAYIVVRDAAGEKEVIELKTSIYIEGTMPPDMFNLIVLSNAIDFFGTTNKSANWGEAKRFDFNKDGIINISDISYIASRI